LGVDETTIHNWEDKGVTPALRFIPCIVDFLGYDPTDNGAQDSISEHVRVHRRRLGLSQKRLAALIGIDQSTIAGWERREHLPTRKSLQVIEEFLSRTATAKR
jgi:DNA-binding XRE family transcriptional regulator